MTTFIYALCEPGTRTVRYIGKTGDMKDRLHRHVTESVKLRTHLGCWIKSLSALGRNPDMIKLREVLGDGAEAERIFIKLARGCRMKLVNATDGGDGITMTPETRRKIGLASLGRRPSDSSRAKMSAAKQGPKHNFFGTRRSEETKLKMRNAALLREGKLRGRKDTEEVKARKSASARRAWKIRKERG